MVFVTGGPGENKKPSVDAVVVYGVDDVLDLADVFVELALVDYLGLVACGQLVKLELELLPLEGVSNYQFSLDLALLHGVILALNLWLGLLYAYPLLALRKYALLPSKQPRYFLIGAYLLLGANLRFHQSPMRLNEFLLLFDAGEAGVSNDESIGALDPNDFIVSIDALVLFRGGGGRLDYLFDAGGPGQPVLEDEIVCCGARFPH